jgi:hypothetical protein
VITDADFEWLDERARFALFTLSGPFAISPGVQLIAEAIAAATARDIRGLVVDIRGIEGVASPGVGARHEFARTWAAVAGPRLRVAMVSRPEFIDPEKFGMVAARNFGLIANIFETQAEAVYWLHSESLLDL